MFRTPKDAQWLGQVWEKCREVANWHAPYGSSDPFIENPNTLHWLRNEGAKRGATMMVRLWVDAEKGLRSVLFYDCTKAPIPYGVTEITD